MGLMLLTPLTAHAQQIEMSELSDTKPHDGPEIWQQVAAPKATWGSIDVRYGKKNVPREGLSATLQLEGWRGERVNAQAVVYSRTPLEGVSVQASPLRSGKNTIAQEQVEVNVVGYVLTDELNKDGKSGCSSRPDKTKWDSSLVADRLQPARGTFSVEGMSTRPLWVTIDIPRTAAAGTYRGTLTVSARGMAAQTLPYTVKVSRHTLTEAREWPFHLDLWQNPYSIARYFNVDLWSPRFFELARPIMTRLARAGQKVITTSIIDKPWNGQTEDPFNSMVGKTRRLDGTWSYNYDVFDRWVQFMMDCGITEQINCYTLVPWAFNFDYFDEARNSTVSLHATPDAPAYRTYWLGFLKDFAAHLKSKGWFERTTIAMDERPLASMRAALKVIHEADPAFKVSGAIKYMPEIEPQVYDLCLAYADSVPTGVVARRRSEGKVTTFYTCCAEAYPNTFTFSNPAEAEFLPWHALAVGVDGYLRWAYNSWTLRPNQDSRFRSWAAGDCYLVYPEGSSIRFERLMMGMQDVEKVRLLRQEFTAKGQKSKLRRLNEIVRSFDIDHLHGLNAPETVNRARRALAEF